MNPWGSLVRWQRTERWRCRRGVLACAAACLLAVACTEALDSTPSTVVDAGADGDAGDFGDVSTDSFVLPDNLEAPIVRITTPADGDSVSEALRIEGTGFDDVGIASVFVQVGGNTPVPARSDSGFGTWYLDAVAPLGSFEIRAWGFDVDGVRSATDDVILVTRSGGGPDASAPSVLIESPDDNSTPLQTLVAVRGTATDDRAVVRMETSLNGEVLTERSVDTSDNFAHWSRLLPLVPGETNTVTITAYDALGNSGADTITLNGRPEADGEAPLVQISAPVAGDVNTDELTVSGTASDNVGIREVKVRFGARVGGGGDDTITWQPYQFADSSDGFATWTTALDIPVGEVIVQARAIDLNGLGASDEVTVNNTFVAEWSAEETYFLRIRAGDERPTVLMELDKEGVNEVINEDIQREIVLTELDPTILLENTLDEIKAACGTEWRSKDSPTYNCDLTALGRSFVGPDGTWRTSPEYAMVRLLTMTPKNANVEGTSIGEMKSLADGINALPLIGSFAGDFGDILAETLDIGVHQEVLGTAEVAIALRDGFVGTHPYTTRNPPNSLIPLLPVTLYDAMNNLSPMGVSMGPDAASGHPGVMDPSSPPFAEVIDEDTFRMIVEGTSNLVWHDGIDLSAGSKDYIATVVDTIGPAFDDVVEFDFGDPNRFQIEGLVPNPVADLTFTLYESPDFVNACVNDDACKNSLPGMPRNNASVWSYDPWLLESIFAAGGYLTYNTRVANVCYPFSILGGCPATIHLGQNGDPPGWSEFSVLFNLGNPPDPQYVWEMLTEVAQVVQHENVTPTPIPEGAATVKFTVQDVPAGVSAESLRTEISSYLADQASLLADRLLGDYFANNGAVDFFYRRGNDGQRALYFVHPDDPLPQTYNYDTVGFYSSPDLGASNRVSTTTIAGSGDSVHEKLAITAGTQTVYLADDTGGTYRLRIEANNDSDEITVHVSRRML